MPVKSNHEIEVVTELLKSLEGPEWLHISIESKIPDEPDILVTFVDRKEYFEVARILDHRWFNLRLKALRFAPWLVRVTPRRFGLPEKDILIKKLRKQYTAYSRPVNLLLYYDTGIYYGAVPPVDLPEFYNTEIKPLLIGNTKFNGIFIYDRLTQRVLWKC